VGANSIRRFEQLVMIPVWTYGAWVGVATLSGAFTYEIPWGLLAAGVIARSLPLIAMVVIFHRRIVAGLAAGAGK
jgi:ABC-type glycerol-3-phosphate transport system permease component